MTSQTGAIGAWALQGDLHPVRGTTNPSPQYQLLFDPGHWVLALHCPTPTPAAQRSAELWFPVTRMEGQGLGKEQGCAGSKPGNSQVTGPQASVPHMKGVWGTLGKCLSPLHRGAQGRCWKNRRPAEEGTRHFRPTLCSSLGSAVSDDVIIKHSLSHMRAIRKISPRSQAWWHMPTNPALGRLRQDCYELEASLGYTAISCLKRKRKNKRKTPEGLT